MRTPPDTPRRQIVRSPALMPRLKKACVACAAGLLMGTALTTSVPASAADTLTEQELQELVNELNSIPPEEIAKNPEGWQRVFDLVQQYVGNAQKPGQAAAAAGLDAGEKEQIGSMFRQIITHLREVQVVDIASKAMAGGLESKQASSPQGRPGRGSTAEWTRLIDPSSGGPSPGLDPATQEALMMLSTPDGANLLIRQIEAGNASLNNSDTLNRKNKEAIAQLKTRADRAGEDLLLVQQAAASMSGRLSEIESLVQQAQALDGSNAKGDAAKLAELRGRLSTLTSTQNKELATLSNPAGINRSTGPNPYQGI